ncbi:DUF4255 domain-containing protein [Granulicella sibirica]|uniref:Glutamine synthetase adenylyltransferase n=1 Tax=Granulicella sibirica TaxID=2479048 RepID=A0A4Q0SZ51_9BACT|nr:DUF4255 domain-containing protein [Granulicella sibirica]RXH56525.1 Glutamine synthetase adenylyltransferase [Granulicella sibirica]
MSSAAAVAAATMTLQAILGGVTADPSLSDTMVTILPPDKARGNLNSNQLNLFLYQVLPDAAWRNMNVPSQVAPGESGIPPLALTLFYLLTAFGKDNDATTPNGHLLLGSAMSILHDHALLGPQEIQLATAASLPGNNLDTQADRVRITLQPLSIEEISKLWTGFATQYRLSVAYEVSVVLIDSTLPSRTPLPVLTRGPGDKGIASQTNLSSPYPALTTIGFAANQVVAQLGGTLTLMGSALDGTSIGVLFSHPLFANPIEVAPIAGSSSTQISVQIPSAPALWPAGYYTVGVMVQRPGESYRRSTNQLAFALAPKMTITPKTAPGPNITYTVTSSPQIWPTQRASLLLGSQEVLSEAHATQTATLTFNAAALPAGDLYARLRVDGVDSIYINRSTTPPAFDPTQKVTVS